MCPSLPRPVTGLELSSGYTLATLDDYRFLLSFVQTVTGDEGGLLTQGEREGVVQTTTTGLPTLLFYLGHEIATKKIRESSFILT